MKKIIILFATILYCVNINSQEVITSIKYYDYTNCGKPVDIVWEIIKKENPNKLFKQYQQLYIKLHLNTDCLLLGEFRLRYRVSNDIAGHYSNEQTISIPLYSLEQFMEAHEKEFYLGEAFFGYTKDLNVELICDPDPDEDKMSSEKEIDKSTSTEEDDWNDAIEINENAFQEDIENWEDAVEIPDIEYEANDIVWKKDETTFTDTRDGKTYKIVKIGSQTWMAENLNYITGNSWCYDNSSSNCNKYGRLYDWETAKKACPSGWHLPSRSEFETLLSNAGGSGSNAYHALKDVGSSGFSALFGGWRYSDGGFNNVGSFGSWWSSSEYGTFNAWYLYMYSSSQDAYVDSYYETYGFSVRCLQD
jgi:uncharacterized protein (TIGR02145 family)